MVSSINNANNTNASVETSSSKSIVVTPQGLNLLGCTFNALTSPYGDQDKVSASPVVLGIGIGNTASYKQVNITQSVAYSVPSILTANPEDEKIYFLRNKESYQETSEALSERVSVSGSDGTFSATITETDNYQYTKSKATWCSVILDGTCYMNASFDKSKINGNDLSLDNTFKDDLNGTMDPKEFFNKYGTHIVCGIRLGGEIQYSCTAEASSYSSSNDFSIDAQANYYSMTGSANAKASFEEKTSNYEENISVYIKATVSGGKTSYIGGTDDGYTNWANSILMNPAFMEFTASGGLLPVWELCKSSDRADKLCNAFKGYYHYHLTTVPNSYLQGSVQGSNDKTDYYTNKKTGEILNETMKEYSKNFNYPKYWVADSNEATLVVTGFGCNINSSNHVNHMLVQTLDLSSGKLAYHNVGDGSTQDPNNYQEWYQVPQGSVITGLALKHSDNKAKYMKIFHQKISCNDSADGFLDQDVSEETHGADQNSNYEVEYMPIQGDSKNVITGILVNCTHKNNHHGFNQLVLQQATLKSTQASTS